MTLKTRQVEFTESVKLGTSAFAEGDRHTFPEEEASEYIRLGWCKCVETGEQGERKPGQQKINIHATRQELGGA